METLEQKVTNVLQQVPFGENGGNVVDQEIVYAMDVESGIATAVIIITPEFDKFKIETVRKIEAALLELLEIKEVNTKVVASKEEAEAATAPQTQQPVVENYLSNYKNVIMIASGKGGVGKSTVAVNLAMALKALGKSVSILDADIYGPSMPAMLNCRGEFHQSEKSQILPLKKYGVSFMSIGGMVAESDAVIWRGPMAHQAIQQLLRDSAWPGGDYMIVDLPPGTGDVQISLAQMTQSAGTVVVCTPQDVAMLDARKAISMFDKVNIPVLGLIENMSSFVCPKCGAETPIFSKGGVERESVDKEIPFLGRIPIELEVRLGGDSGEPVVEAMPKSKIAQTFKEIAQTLINELEEDE